LKTDPIRSLFASLAARVLWLGLLLALPLDAAAAEPLRVISVPFVSQSEALCGGAAAAMVLRFWGERGVDAQSFAHLVDKQAGGIRTTDLLKNLEQRGWAGVSVPGSEARLADEINRNGRPVLVLLEDRPGVYHYVVVVGAPERGFIFHDPARTPYRVLSRVEFVSRWRPTSMWMALVAAKPAATPNDVPIVTADGPAPACEQAVDEGVRLAQAGDYGAAEARLVSALSCPGGAAYRELAGLRAVQKRWNDTASLAETAVQADASDAYAWRLLATARFLLDDRPGALAALNQAGEPAIDTIQIAGLRRTRARVIEKTIDLESGELLSQGALERARRRLNDVPSIRSATLDFAPVSGGRAEVRATVNERHLFPTTFMDIAEIGGRALFQQDPRVSISSLTGGGERLDVQYRFRPGRPRLGATFSAPAPWGGVWSIRGLWERQPFDTPLVPTSERTTGRLAWTGWITGRFQVSVRGGADSWQDIGSRGALGGMAYVTSLDDRASVRLDVDTWLGDTRFSSAKTIAKYRSSNRLEGLVFVSSAGAGIASDGLPVESWFAGDSGNARPGPVPLRAHGLIHDSRYFRTEQMGRGIVHGIGRGAVLVPAQGIRCGGRHLDPGRYWRHAPGPAHGRGGGFSTPPA
jgi:predicted double-glycine peptidase